MLPSSSATTGCWYIGHTGWRTSMSIDCRGADDHGSASCPTTNEYRSAGVTRAKSASGTVAPVTSYRWLKAGRRQQIAVGKFAAVAVFRQKRTFEASGPSVAFGSIAELHHTPKAALRTAGIEDIADLAIHQLPRLVSGENRLLLLCHFHSVMPPPTIRVWPET